MKILSTYVTTTTQIHNGKCYFIGLSSESKDALVYDIEGGGTGGSTNTIFYQHNGTGNMNCILPKPGIECSNGLNIAIDGNATVFWSLG